MSKLYKTKEGEKFFIFWQKYPRTTGLTNIFMVFTSDVSLAKNIRERKRSDECDIRNDKSWLFEIEFYNKEKAIKSFTTLINRNDYPKFKVNATKTEFTSILPLNIVTNTKPEVS